MTNSTTKFNLTQHEIGKLISMNTEIIDQLDDKFNKIEIIDIQLLDSPHEEFTEFLEASKLTLQDSCSQHLRQLKANQMMLLDGQFETET